MDLSRTGREKLVGKGCSAGLSAILNLNKCENKWIERTLKRITMICINVLGLYLDLTLCNVKCCAGSLLTLRYLVWHIWQFSAQMLTKKNTDEVRISFLTEKTIYCRYLPGGGGTE